jgi:cytochrome c biogenesis protein CcmG, thiol:disulfide interchange protein DsbE
MGKALPLLLALAGLFAAAALGAGCGGAQGGDYGGSHPDYAKALAGSPAPLAALHAQGDRLLPGGKDAYEKRIAALHGYPVVANMWASWCIPCRSEFPSFQNVAAKYGRKVAFLGVNVEDSNDAAATFLAEVPVPYPSYTDPDKEVVESLDIHVGYPDTAFYDRSGKLLYVHLGQYRDQAQLEEEVRHYALGGA